MEGSRVSLLKAGTWTSHPVDGSVTAFAKDESNGDTWATAYSSAPDGSGRTHLNRWDGSTWSRVGDSFGTNEVVGSLAAARGVVWAGGTNIYRREGGRSEQIECPNVLPSGSRSFSVYAIENDAWAASDLGRIYRISAKTCTDVTPVSTERLKIVNISGARGSDVWITGAKNGENLLLHWNGLTFDAPKLAFDPRFTTASVTPLGHLWVGASHGAVLRAAIPKSE